MAGEKGCGMEPVIRIEGVWKRFGALEVLKGLSMEIAKGEIVALVGPSGSGKSTLVRCINGLEAVDGGSVQIDGRTVTDARMASEKVGMVFQNFNLFPHYSAIDNIRRPLRRIRRLSEQAADALARDLLETVRLSDKAEAYPAQLSGGQKQRVAIARALSMNPEIILFDEPTSSLDPELAYEVFDTMRSIVRPDLTIVLVTHQLNMVRSFASRVLFLEGGGILFDGTPEALFNSEHPRIRQFLERVAQ